MEAREIEEKYRDWYIRLELAIAAGSGAEVEEGARMVLGLAAIINPYYPKVWGDHDDRQIESILKQAIDRVNGDISQGRIPQGDTLENYQAYARNIQMRYEDVRDRLLAEWAVDRKLYGEIPEIAV